ncbi:MAG: TIGR04024 family LLM class F420-dependent oxidoreductase [Halobacteriota archaeon]
MTENLRRGLVLPMDAYDDLDAAVDTAQMAEELGYGFVTMGETNGRNVPLVLGLLADRTTDIGIADDVLSPFSRTPTTLGQTAATLQELSGGRFRLRLGTSSPALVERWHGVEFDRPLRHVREAVEIIRQVQSGDRLDYDGEIFSPDTLKLESPAPEPPAPVDVAALGPKATEMAGRFADGWVPQLLTIDALEERLADLRRGAELGDRTADELLVTPHLRACAIEDGSRARRHARQHVAFMIARYGPYYRKAIADAGWADVTEAVRSAWDDGDRDGALAAIPDELLDDLVAAGTPNDAREQLERFEAVDGVDAVQVSFFGPMDEAERRATMRALAPR